MVLLVGLQGLAGSRPGPKENQAPCNFPTTKVPELLTWAGAAGESSPCILAPTIRQTHPERLLAGGNYPPMVTKAPLKT